MQLILGLPILLVVIGLFRVLSKLAGVCALHRVKKKYDMDAWQRPKYPENAEEAVKYLSHPAFDAVKELYKTKWKYHALMASGLIAGVLLLIGITLQIRGMGGILAFLGAVLIFPQMMTWRSACKQVKVWTDLQGLEGMRRDKLMETAAAFEEISTELSPGNLRENEKRWKRLCGILLGLTLLLAGLQAYYCLGVREVEPGILQRAGYQYRLREDGGAEIVRYVGIWKKTRVPAAFRGHPVTSVASRAFSNPSENYSAFGRKDMEEIRLPESLTEIGDEAFQYCSGLTSMTIPSGVTRIGNNAFYNCWKLRSVSLPESLREIGDEAFCGCPIEEMQLPEGLKTIGAQAFKNCSFSAVNIPDSVEDMGNNPFASCWKLREIRISEEHPAFFVQNGALCRREGGALICCPGMDSITAYRVPDGILVIEDYAFFDARALQQLTLPEGLTSIGDHAFASCSELTKVTLPDSLVSIGAYAFSSCGQLNGIELPAGLTSLGENAFFHCKSLTEISIPAGVTEIGFGTFSNDSSLRRVEIPEGVTFIDSCAFMGCDSLETLVIPESVSKIGIYEPFPARTTLIVTPGSYAEQICRNSGLNWQYPEEP